MPIWLVYRYGPPGSAICVYGADMSTDKDRGIFTIFGEEYRNLRPGQTSCTANNVPNDNPFTVSGLLYKLYVHRNFVYIKYVHTLLLHICPHGYPGRGKGRSHCINARRCTLSGHSSSSYLQQNIWFVDVLYLITQ